jgi:predicted ATPase/class 3 adenylate cyclase/DNA-binding CsgD family transcriptional regulator/tetratricopeptide (TPR) repeat protein
MAWTGTPLIWGESPVGRGIEDGARFHLPAGTVTFLLSDIEGSTRLWSECPDGMGAAVADTYAILDQAVAGHDGVRPVEQGEGDSVVAAFSRASDAVAAALEAQRALHAHTWPGGIDLRVRVALHTADAQLRDEGNYFGVALSRCARLRAIAAGGQTLLSRATRDLVVDRLPDGVELVDSGVHRLRDLGRPEHVFALAHPDLGAETRVLRSMDALPNNLPDQLTSFIGREQELAQLRQALGETRLLTLTGAGGAGKTRLALQLAADALERFAGGTWWVELAPLADPHRVGEVLAAALQIRPLPGTTALQTSCDHLTGSCALIVLDNCEHVLAAAADAAEALLHSCPEVTVIATSRTPLGVAGETDWRVPSLALPPPERQRETLRTLGQFDAVRLFIERARKARPNFTVTNDNAPSVAQICLELDGLPLAIELAAARVRMLSVEQIAAGLVDRFHLLTGGTRTALPRQQTLRASVEWSHELLSEPERVLLRRLAAFAGGFTLDLAEQVGADDTVSSLEILDVLTSLVDKSLVMVEERTVSVRYRLLETVRQYALERLIEAGEESAGRDRHRDVMLDYAEQIAPTLNGHGQRDGLEALDHEAANLSTALDRAVDTDGERAMRICVTLTFWWKLRGLFIPAERGFVRALEVGDPTSSALRARTLFGRGYLACYAGAIGVAFEALTQAVDMAEAVGDDSTVARALMMQGWLQLFPDPAGSRATSTRSLRLAEASGDDWALLCSKVNLVFTYLFRHELEPGQRLLDEVQPVSERLGFLELESWCWLGRCWPAWVAGDRERMEDFTSRALAASRAVGEPSTEALAHCFMAGLELAQGDAEAAVARLEPMRAHVLAAGAGLAIAYVEYYLAPAHAARGDVPQARAGLEQLTAEPMDQGYMFAMANATLADILRVSGEDEQARTHAATGLTFAERVGAPVVISQAKEILGRVACADGDWIAAERLLHESLSARTEHGMVVWVPQTFDALAEVAFGLGSYEEAARLLGAAERSREDLGLRRWAPDDPRFARLADALAEELGAADYASAHQDGHRLSLPEAVTWIRGARGERKRPGRGWESLTPTELRVVELVSEGLTNPQIGERMFITRGTVKVHLSHIFAKVGISTRAELAAAATRRALAT